MARNNTHFTFADLERLTHEAIEQVTTNDRKKAVHHCLKVPKAAWSNDEMVENAIDEVFCLNGKARI